MLAKYEKKGYKLDDNILLATTFYYLTPDSFSDLPEEYLRDYMDGSAYRLDGDIDTYDVDSDLTEDVKKIKCDILFVPIGGTYTMSAREASYLTNMINPRLVIPVHYNDIVGSKKDEKEFLKGLKGVEYKLFL